MCLRSRFLQLEIYYVVSRNLCIAAKIHERVNLTFTQVDFCIQINSTTVTNKKHTLKAQSNMTTHKENNKNTHRTHFLDKVHFQFNLNIAFSLKKMLHITDKANKNQDFSISHRTVCFQRRKAVFHFETHIPIAISNVSRSI